jgi:hypothetical protein
MKLFILLEHRCDKSHVSGQSARVLSKYSALAMKYIKMCPLVAKDMSKFNCESTIIYHSPKDLKDLIEPPRESLIYTPTKLQ